MSVKFRCKCGVELIAFMKKPGEKLKCHACGAELMVPYSSSKDAIRTGVIHTLQPREIHKLKMMAQGTSFEDSGDFPASLKDEISGEEPQDASSTADAGKLQELPSLDEILGEREKD